MLFIHSAERCINLGAFLILCMAILLCPISGRAASTDETPPTVSVSGHAEVAAPSDQATVRLGALVQDVEAVEAQVRVNQIMKKALRGIKAAGVAEQDIQTVGLSLMPVYAVAERSQNRDSNEPKIAGYRASNTVTVKVEDLDLLGKVIDAGVLAGANQLRGVTFDVRDNDKLQQQALQLATKNAQQKAEAIAAALHMRLGMVLEVQEEAAYLQHPTVARGYTMAAAEATPVQPGQVQVSADVRIRYRISGQGNQ